LSIDLDVLDPAFAPGVGNPEAMGVTPRELFDMIYAMDDTQISCMDIVELCPPYDMVLLHLLQPSSWQKLSL
jgi:agmatinase